MAGIELATAYVSLVATTKGLRQGVAKEFAGVEKDADRAGKKLGQAYAKATASGAKEGLDALKRQVDDAASASRKAAAEVAKATKVQKDATDVLAIAEARLAETRANGKAKQSSILSAERSVAAARERLESSTTKVAAAEAKAKSAAELSTSATKRLATETRRSEVEQSKFRKALDRTGAGARASADKVKSAWSGMGGRLRSAIGNPFAGLIAGGAVVAGFKSVTGAASELEQSVGGVAAVFKGDAKEIEVASKNAAANLGLSRNAYNELATTLGAGLKNKGVKDYADQTQGLIKIGADLAAQYGGSTQQAVEALSSAMRGESDPIERYGVALNETAVNAELARQGVVKSGGAYTEQQKTMARLALITKQTSDAQGAFGREADTQAGKQARLSASWENIKTTLGEKLLPVLSNVTGKVSTFVTQMDTGTGAGGRFKDQVQGIADKVMGVVSWIRQYSSVIVPLGAGILAVVAAMRAWKAITTAITVVQAALNIVMSANPIGIVVLAIIGLVAALVVAYKKSETFRNIVNGVWASVKSAISGTVNWFKNTAWPAMRDAFGWIAGKAKWMWENGIRPAFNNIKAGLGAVKSAFGAAKDWIGKTWSGLSEKISGPLDTAMSFIRTKFVEPMAKMLDKIGLGSLASNLRSAVGLGSTAKGQGRKTSGGTTSYATGGWTGPGSKYTPAGVVHADEYVIRKESQRSIAKAAPGLLDALNAYGANAIPGYAIGGKVGGLNSDFVKRLSQFNAAAGGRYSVLSGLRTRREQEILYARYLNGTGNLAARPGTSRHESGLAADLTPSNARNVHGRLAAQFGLHFPVRGESWHVEPMGKVRGFLTAVGNAVANMADLLSPLKEKAIGWLKNMPGGMWGQAAGALARKAIDGVMSKGANLLGGILGGGYGSGSYSPMTGSARSIGQRMAAARGWTGSQWKALEALWQKESGWNHLARNPSSGAYGIPQSLPGSKMASAGADWRTNPQTQIAWGLGYIAQRYGSPAAAWAHSQRLNWYANGGITRAGLAMVGERGPELVQFSGGQRVYSNAESRAMVAGGVTKADLIEAVEAIASRPLEVYVDGQWMDVRAKRTLDRASSSTVTNPRKGVLV